MKEIIEFYSKEQIKNGVFGDLIEELVSYGFDRKKAVNEVMKYLRS